MEYERCSFAEAKPAGNGQASQVPGAPGWALHFCPASCARVQAMLKSTLPQFHSSQYLQLLTKGSLASSLSTAWTYPSLSSHVIYLSVFLRDIYCYWLRPRTGICEHHTRYLVMDGRAFSDWRSFLCLSVPLRQTYSHEDTILTHWPIFQMGHHLILMANCADFFRGLWENDNEISGLHLLITTY